MLNKFFNIESTVNFIDIRYLWLIAKKNIKNLIGISFLVCLIALFVSLNQEKKFISKATIVIYPEDNNIVNIEEVYNVDRQSNRINNQIAILKSDQVKEYILNDKDSIIKFKSFYNNIEVNFLQRIFKKKERLMMD